MPNWKKVITSGSNAALNSLYAPHITGSLYGTASWAINAKTASFSTRTTQIDVYVKNQSGAAIPKGKVIRITGSNSSSDIPRIVTASYLNDNNSANTLGITAQAIPNGGEGYVISEGVLTGIDTNAFYSGQLLYLGPTGSIIGTAPVAPLHAVRLGEVIRHQSNNGSIYVRIDNGYEIGELHDVRDTTTNTSHGDLLVKSGSVWKNTKQLTGSYGITGSLSVRDHLSGINVLDTKTYVLRGTNVNTSLDWAGRTLNSSAGAEVLSWRFLRGLDSTGKLSYSWANRTLNDTNATSSINWQTRFASDSALEVSLDWQNRYTVDSLSGISLDWDSRYAVDSAVSISLDWENRYALDAISNPSLDWRNRYAIDSALGISLDWQNRAAVDSALGVSLDWESRVMNDSIGNQSVDYNNRYLFDSTGQFSADWNNRDLLDSTGAGAVNYDIPSNVSAVQQFAWTRALIDIPTVAEPLAYWSNYNKYLPTGEILTGVTFDGSVVDYDLVGLREDGIWYPQDAASVTVATKLMGIAFNVGVSNNVLLEGTAVVASSSFGSAFVKVDKLQFGLPIYLNTTSSAGNYMSTTAPSLPGQYVRILGHVYYRSTNDSDYYLMKFKPSHEVYEI